MTTTTSDSTLDALAWAVAADGVDRHLDAVRALGRHARAVGVSPVLVGIMLSVDEPAVARSRAFGAVALAVSARSEAAPRRIVAA